MKKYILPVILLAVGVGIATAASFAAKKDNCCQPAQSCCETADDCCNAVASAIKTADCCQPAQSCCETAGDCCIDSAVSRSLALRTA